MTETFVGRSYAHEGGHKGWAIRFADSKQCRGVATTSYSYGMSDEQRTEMARRITAALNLVRHLDVEQIEALARRVK
jgi:hypothetical protein